MRPMLSEEQISANGTSILAQLQRYLNLDNGTTDSEKSQAAPKAGRFLNNADWLLTVNYIEFLRDIGKHFRVNEMIKAEGYRQRLTVSSVSHFLNLTINCSKRMITCVFFKNTGAVSNWVETTSGAIFLPVLVSSAGSKANRFTLSLFHCSRQRAVRKWKNCRRRGLA